VVVMMVVVVVMMMMVVMHRRRSRWRACSGSRGRRCLRLGERRHGCNVSRHSNRTQ
jgi:hypothetical protein